ncbi:MAG: hypothetical protein ISS16_01675 [Ignavibacteria bacterium]|nr:hypothetical protein [Ignavibacteria bacterium]
MDTLIIKEVSDKYSFYGVSPDTIFTVIITLSIFLLGFVIKGFYEWLMENMKLKKTELFFYSLLDSLIKTIDEQIEIDENLSRNIMNEEVRDFFYDEKLFALTKSFNSLEYLDLFKIFILKKKKLNLDEKNIVFIRIIKIIEYIKEHSKSSEKIFYQFLNDAKRFERDWGINISFINNTFNSFRSDAKRLDIGPSKDPFLKEMDIIFHNLGKQKNYRFVSIANNNLIKPLKILCDKMIEDEKAKKILPAVMNCWEAHDNVFKTKNLYSDFLLKESNDLKDKKELLEKAIIFFKN